MQAGKKKNVAIEQCTGALNANTALNVDCNGKYESKEEEIGEEGEGGRENKIVEKFIFARYYCLVMQLRASKQIANSKNNNKEILDLKRKKIVRFKINATVKNLQA
jgi:hypothetical protein